MEKEKKKKYEEDKKYPTITGYSQKVTGGSNR
jgi:hypothetical protein